MGAWTDAEDTRVPDSTVYAFHGFEHCGTEDVWQIGLGRDWLAPERDRGGELFIRGKGDASLPTDATDTGFRNDDIQLWIAADRSAAYLVFEDRTERWPSTTIDVLSCD